MDFRVSYSPFGLVIIGERGEMLEIFEEFGDEFGNSIRSKANNDNVKFIVDSQQVQDVMSKLGQHSTLDVTDEFLSNWRINRYDKHLNEIGLISDYNNYISRIRETAIQETRQKLREASNNRDELVAQIVNAIDDLQRTLNLTSNRLSELYSLHFPELVDIISNTVTLAKIILNFPGRDMLQRNYLQSLKIPENKIDQILHERSVSVGGVFEEIDLNLMKTLANSMLATEKDINSFENWIEQNMNTIAPNLTAVSGPNVGARLISAMGSLRTLAMKSSSKIQTIGAERALYSALRNKGTPPKHGIIFQIPEIGNSPFWLRGKLSRAYSSKIALAARLDYFNGEFLGESMRSDLRNLEKKLRADFPNPPTKKPKTSQKSPKKRIKGRRT